MSGMTLISRLSGALQQKLGLEECADAAALLDAAKAKPRFLCPAQPMRIAGYYDLQPSAVVYDPSGCTLGLVEQILNPGDAAAIRAALDEAASVRQLLLEQTDLDSQAPASGGRKVALQVELVILTEAPVPESESALRQVLTDIARQTGYVRLIGIGVLQPDAKGEFSDASLRRAFPWLLTATRKWFQRPDYSNMGTSWRSAGESFEVRLRDYRIAGTRRLRCNGACNLQIVHGHNGSGKSALTEAIELLMTNGVQRIDEGGETDYFRTVRHRPTGTDDTSLAAMAPAEVSLLNGSPTPVASVVVKPGTRDRNGAAAARLLRANSFRLDQIFMDRIVRNRPEQRAATFLDAFSPSESELLPKLRMTRKAVEVGIAALPQQIAANVPTDQSAQYDWVQKHFAWLRESSTAAPAAPADAAVRRMALDAVLPVPVEELKTLAPLFGPMRDLTAAVEGASTRESLVGAMAQFEEHMKAFFAQLPAMLQHLRTSLRVFEEFKSWSAERRTARGESFRADLDSWLDAVALHDLAVRGQQIASTVSEAARNHWHVPAEDAEIVRTLQTGEVRSQIASRVDALSAQLREARSKVQSWLEEESATANAGGAASPQLSRRHGLTADEIVSLNEAGEWLPSAGKDPLGAAFQKALARGEQVSLVKSAIGVAGGLDPLIAEARAAIAACERMQSAVTGGAPTSSVRLQKLCELVGAVDTAVALGKDLPNSFFQILAGNDSSVLNDLVAAFNELLALMTPARWTYRDIQLGIRMATGDPSVSLTTFEGARADLLFNTAELNAWTLTLFLLLAPRLPNPLSLLVLDDPMQNMDELTVIAVARALCRLTRIYPAGWQILAFFHREDAIARVLDETQAIVYELPWMQPTTSSSDEEISAVHTPEKWPPEIQVLTPKFLSGVV